MIKYIYISELYHPALTCNTDDVYGTENCIIYNEVECSSQNMNESRDTHRYLFNHKAFTGELPHCQNFFFSQLDFIRPVLLTDSCFIYHKLGVNLKRLLLVLVHLTPGTKVVKINTFCPF